MERHEIPLPSTGKTARKKKEQKATASKYPQGYFKDKPCKMCENSFTPNAPSEHYCSDKCKDEGLADAFLHRKYHISLEDYKDLFIQQNGKCKICGTEGSVRASAQHTMPLVIDHCHESGKVRGLLCHTCNSALGQFKDSKTMLLKAIEYLEQPNIEFTKTNRNRIKRDRQIDLAKDDVLNIIIDLKDNNYSDTELKTKYGIKDGALKGIKSLTTVYAQKAYKRYQKLKESATTIPKGSTSQANGDGSGEAPATEEYDIV